MCFDGESLSVVRVVGVKSTTEEEKRSKGREVEVERGREVKRG